MALNNSETAHETLDWNVGGCEWFPGLAGDHSCVPYKAKLTKKRWNRCRDISQPYFFAKSCFLWYELSRFGCSLCCVFLLMQDSRNTAVSCARSSTSRAEEQLCGLNRQRTEGDESTHSAAPRQTLKLWGSCCAVYHSPDFSLHIRCWRNFLSVLKLKQTFETSSDFILQIKYYESITCETVIENRFIWNRASRSRISRSTFFCFHKEKLLGIN